MYHPGGTPATSKTARPRGDITGSELLNTVGTRLSREFDAFYKKEGILTRREKYETQARGPTEQRAETQAAGGTVPPCGRRRSRCHPRTGPGPPTTHPADGAGGHGRTTAAFAMPPEEGGS